MIVEVAYATPKQQSLIALEVPQGSSLAAAVAASGVLGRHPEIPWPNVEVGVFGQRKSQDQVLRPGDRVEIYRPLKLDPKTRRRQRAQR